MTASREFARFRWFVLAGAVGCGGGHSEVDAGQADPPCPTCQLTAVEPAIASAQDALTLEGTFSGKVLVRFAGGEIVAATVLGPHRATVRAIGAVTSGDIALVAGTTVTGRQPFRRTTFPLGMAPFETTPVQIDVARSAPVLASPSFGAAGVVIGGALYVVGGANGGGTAMLDTIDRATINADGSLGAFVPLDGVKLAIPNSFHTATAVGDHLYVVGGANILDGGNSSVEQATINPDGSLGAFAVLPDVRLSVPRDSHTAAVIGNQLYVVGGNGPGGPLAHVERAEIRPDGSLTTFTGVTDLRLVTPRAGHTSAVIGDYLYVVGGRDDGGAPLASVERAPINPDGTLGPFAVVTGVTLVGPRSGHTTAVLGNAMYVHGGTGTAGDHADVERAPINLDGTLGPFVVLPDVALATPRFAATSVIARNYLYVIGGEQSAQRTIPLASIERSSLIAAEDLGTMKTISDTFHLDFFGGPQVVIGNYRYMIGGARGGVNMFDGRIARAAYDADDLLGAYTVVPDLSLNFPRAAAALAVIGTHLYVLGGFSDATSFAPTERAEIHADGSLGPFTMLANPNNLGLNNAIAIAGGYVYALQVVQGTGTVMVRAAIAADGSLGPGISQPLAALSSGQAFYSSKLAVGGSFYLVGGMDDSYVPLNNVARMAINADGTLGPVVEDPTLLPHALGGQGSAVIGNQFYVFGGSVPDPAHPGQSITTPEVLRATIHGDGSLSTFTVVPGLTAGLTAGLSDYSIIGNYLYSANQRAVIGGDP